MKPDIVNRLEKLENDFAERTHSPGNNWIADSEICHDAKNEILHLRAEVLRLKNPAANDFAAHPTALPESMCAQACAA